MNSSILSDGGIDYECGLMRFQNDIQLYKSVLLNFLSDTSFSRAKDAFEKHDRAQLLEHSHELKGVSGNLDLKSLYDASCKLVDLLRADCLDTQLIAAFSDFESAYTLTVEAICRAKEEQ